MRWVSLVFKRLQVKFWFAGSWDVDGKSFALLLSSGNADELLFAPLVVETGVTCLSEISAS